MCRDCLCAGCWLLGMHSRSHGAAVAEAAGNPLPRIFVRLCKALVCMLLQFWVSFQDPAPCQQGPRAGPGHVAAASGTGISSSSRLQWHGASMARAWQHMASDGIDPSWRQSHAGTARALAEGRTSPDAHI